MIKIFKEEDKMTVVFPRDEEAEKAIERILKEIYGEAEDVRESEVQGLLAAGNKAPAKSGVQVITKEPKKAFVRKDDILRHPLNPYKSMIPFDAFKKYGVTALSEYAKMGLNKKVEKDTPILLEIFSDFKKYLISINKSDYMLNTDLEEIKNLILIINKYVYRDPMQKILKLLAMTSVDAFVNESSESQLRSAATKVVKDTISFLK